MFNIIIILMIFIINFICMFYIYVNNNFELKYIKCNFNKRKLLDV